MTGKNPFVMLVNEQTTVLHALYHETLAQLLTSHSLDLKREKILGKHQCYIPVDIQNIQENLSGYKRQNISDVNRKKNVGCSRDLFMFEIKWIER